VHRTWDKIPLRAVVSSLITIIIINSIHRECNYSEIDEIIIQYDRQLSLSHDIKIKIIK